MILAALAAALLLAAGPARARAAPEGALQPESEATDFLEEEARAVTVTASRRPTPIREAPATTYVLTAEDIARSGALTIYDALRLIPGVDVIEERDFEGDVGIRGLDAHAANRVLILLDGRTVLNGYFDSLDWETIPVGLADIDRVEVVEGPASALYGGNAESGVINIITKTPAQLDGAEVRYAVGNRATQIVSAAAGRKTGSLGYKLGAGWRSADRFDAPGHAASDAARANGLFEWTPRSDRRYALSGGLVRHDTQVFGPPTGAFDNGWTGFLRGDARWGKTRARGFWNAGRAGLTNLTTLNGPTLDYEIFDASLARTQRLVESDSLSGELEWRRNQARSNVFGDRGVAQELYSAALENDWRPRDDVELVAGARVDHHELAGWTLSPRVSAMWYLTGAQTLRASFGDAFRNPTLLENYADTTVNLSASVQAHVSGASNLRPERLREAELAWRGAFSRVRATAAVFHYRLTSLIGTGSLTTVSAGPPELLQASEVNRGATRAFGYELGLEADLSAGFTGFANYSYQSFKDEQPWELFSVQSPKHKGNVGTRWKAGPWTAQLWLHAVDQTLWSDPAGGLGRVPAYAILNGSLAYRFSGRWQGLEAGAGAFNLTDNAHAELLPAQGGTVARGRWYGRVSWRFP